MSETPSILVRSDQILIGDMISVGGAQHSVIANHPYVGNNRNLILRYDDVIKRLSYSTKLIANKEMTFFVIR